MKPATAFSAIAIMAALAALGQFANCAPAGDVDGLNLEPRPGPMIWVEEHWDVKVDQFDAFTKVYDAEYYALARRISGYRGYTVLTSIAGEEEKGPPRPTAYQGVNTPLGGGERFISIHPGLWLEGRVLTGRSVNVGAAMGKTYNVIIIHHFQTWADAERFPAAIAALYSKEHDNGDLTERLSKTLYPLVRNVWTATYRMIKTGYPRTPPYVAAKPKKSPDADGLDLEPHAGPKVVIEEHWDVPKANVQAFLDAYEREVYSTIRKVAGYRGYSTFTAEPPGPGEPTVPLPLGPSAEFYVSRPGMLIDGEVRTDRAINAGALFRNTFNLKILHYMDNWTDADNFAKNFNAAYAATHDGVLPWSRNGWTRSLTPLANNHWDMFYRLIRTSFQPGPAADD